MIKTSKRIGSLVLRLNRTYSSTCSDLTLPNGMSYKQPTGLFINNKFIVSGHTLITYYPATGKPITSVYSADSDDVNTAVLAARSAFETTWCALSGTERGILLGNLSRLIQKHQNLLGCIESWDTGKPVKAAIQEDIEECVNVSRYYAGWADKLHGETIQPFQNKLAYTLREPLGVCGLIVPWNYPLMLAIWKLAPALATGNTVVIKSSELSPLSALYLGNLITEAGFPPGTVNIISGDQATGAALVRHSGLNKISFTGSIATGKKIMKLAANNLTPVTLELGGKSAALVFADANLEQAVKWCHLGIMSNMGQICTATSRILVHESVADKFISLMRDTVVKLSKIMSPFANDAFHGPQISASQLAKVAQFVDSGIEEGARLVCGGKVVEGHGHYYEPTIFSGVKDNMKISSEEIFGPVVTIDSFASTDEAVTRANNSVYGLGSAVFTNSISLAHDAARKLQAGMVWINSSNDSDFRVPFGGYKQSGFGRELGEHALSSYTQTKAVHLNMGTTL
ncbi:aldehyde dehydrogenase domain-containing protein [Lipomyces arxii]|uniref:aldehyde dehydrogenase domain-containing protein n=1 Tax=Lipomyces arxii TaxID=56418 RepID=UPI0034CF4832